ncbi:hypothetical protein PR048_015760, partial [Dryococelus australis]
MPVDGPIEMFAAWSSDIFQRSIRKVPKCIVISSVVACNGPSTEMRGCCSSRTHAGRQARTRWRTDVSRPRARVMTTGMLRRRRRQDAGRTVLTALAGGRAGAPGATRKRPVRHRPCCLPPCLSHLPPSLPLSTSLAKPPSVRIPLCGRQHQLALAASLLYDSDKLTALVRQLAPNHLIIDSVIINRVVLETGRERSPVQPPRHLSIFHVVPHLTFYEILVRPNRVQEEKQFRVATRKCFCCRNGMRTLIPRPIFPSAEYGCGINRHRISVMHNVLTNCGASMTPRVQEESPRRCSAVKQLFRGFCIGYSRMHVRVALGYSDFDSEYYQDAVKSSGFSIFIISALMWSVRSGIEWPDLDGSLDRVDEDESGEYEAALEWNARAGENGRPPEKTRRPAASSGTIPTCANPAMTLPGIEPSSPRWEASSLSIASPRSPGGTVVVRPLTSHQGEQSSIPGGVAPGFWHVGIVPDDATGRRVFSGIFHFTPLLQSSAALYSPHSPSSALETSVLRAAQIRSLTHSHLNVGVFNLDACARLWEQCLGRQLTDGEAGHVVSRACSSTVRLLLFSPARRRRRRPPDRRLGAVTRGEFFAAIRAAANPQLAADAVSVCDGAGPRVPDRLTDLECGHPAPPTSLLLAHPRPLPSLPPSPDTHPGLPRTKRGRDGVVVRLLASHIVEPGSIPDGVAPGSLHVGIVPSDAAGRRVFSGISRFSALSFRSCSTLTSLHPNLLTHSSFTLHN